ncbi:hypothetical protein D3C74_285340 [compost metagenome]
MAADQIPADGAIVHAFTSSENNVKHITMCVKVVGRGAPKGDRVADPPATCCKIGRLRMKGELA